MFISTVSFFAPPTLPRSEIAQTNLSLTIGKDRLPTTIFQGRTVELPGGKQTHELPVDEGNSVIFVFWDTWGLFQGSVGFFLDSNDFRPDFPFVTSNPLGTFKCCRANVSRCASGTFLVWKVHQTLQVPKMETTHLFLNRMEGLCN